MATVGNGCCLHGCARHLVAHLRDYDCRHESFPNLNPSSTPCVACLTGGEPWEGRAGRVRQRRQVLPRALAGAGASHLASSAQQCDRLCVTVNQSLCLECRPWVCRCAAGSHAASQRGAAEQHSPRCCFISCWIADPLPCRHQACLGSNVHRDCTGFLSNARSTASCVGSENMRVQKMRS
jgi:hypothetical protein